jgi:5'-nucleotidase
MIETTDEQGNKCYRLGGEFINIEPEANDTDHWAMNNHYLSVHPCTIDQTAYAEI